jgi:hypothetical protein
MAPPTREPHLHRGYMLTCAQVHLFNPKTGARSSALMTNRSYFQFDTKSHLRRFFASSEGWSSLNKR